MFNAEYSMAHSFSENDVDIIFIYDDKMGQQIFDTPEYGNHNKLNSIKLVPEDKLSDELKKIAPDAVIHRIYDIDPLMHRGAYAICKSLGIPYGKYVAENDITKLNLFVDYFVDCDFLMYAHNLSCITEVIKSYEKKKREKCYWFPYGVGSFEYSIDIEKDKELGSFGYYRSIMESRVKSLNLFVDGLSKIEKKLHVYNPKVVSNPAMDWSTYGKKDHLIVHDSFNIEQSTFIMNQYKIALNFESIQHIENGYTHKLFQTMGCGLPTITYRKKCLEEMFGFSGENLIFIESLDEISYWVDFLLKNDKFRHEIGQRCEKFVHEKYDWFTRFEKIMINENIW